MMISQLTVTLLFQASLTYIPANYLGTHHKFHVGFFRDHDHRPLSHYNRIIRGLTVDLIPFEHGQQDLYMIDIPFEVSRPTSTRTQSQYHHTFAEQQNDLPRCF